MPALKKLKSASGRPAAAPSKVKGKEKASAAPEAMDVDELSENENEREDDDASSASDDSGDDSGDSMDTDAEIELSQLPTKSKQTLKRKRRAIPTSSFGQALTALLDTSPATGTVEKSTPPDDSLVTEQPSTSSSAPDTALLSLKKTSAAKRRKAAEKSEANAKKAQLGERKEREDRNRITDVIGGWGGESERALRKVAQRGVVKLFNVIQTAQQTGTQAASETSSVRGTGKASLPAPTAEGFRTEKKTKKDKAQKDNVIGRAKPAALGQEDFLQSIRAGGIVSKV